MLSDIVVDTNIFVQANNSNDPRFTEASAFLESLAFDCTTELCLDEGFAYDDSNASLIFAEYRENLSPVALGTPILAALFQSSRVKELPRKVPTREHRIINQMISREKPRDRTFLRVAYLSIEKILSSHDYEDFTYAVRERCQNILGVEILDATPCGARL